MNRTYKRHKEETDFQLGDQQLRFRGGRAEVLACAGNRFLLV
jgi:hypothetical protein